MAQNARPNQERQAALRRVRIALLLLLVPAIYNFISFSSCPNGNRIGLRIHGISQTLNSNGFILIVAATWFFGLRAFELVTGGIHSIVARNSKLSDWKEPLYINLRRAPFFAVPGAVLWAICVMAFYQLQLGFYPVSVPIGIAAHILAACL